MSDSAINTNSSKNENIRRIWKVAGILALITAAEFAFAFAWPDTWSRMPLNVWFIILTLAKAFYIVAEFMHLKHEVKTLILSIVLPMAFVVWLIVALLAEGSAIIDAVKNFWG